MIKARFTINIDPASDLVRVSMTGFFSFSDVERFEFELLAAHRKLRCAHKDGPLTINDISEMAIQSQDVMRKWGDFLSNPAHRSRRLAFVVSSSLARMQLQRAIEGRKAQAFLTIAEAERWLFAECATPAT